MGPGRLTGMNGAALEPASVPVYCFNGARSIDRDERPAVPIQTTGRRSGFNGARSIDRDERQPMQQGVGVGDHASMGPGRLTGMNEPAGRVGAVGRKASMGPGRLTGMNDTQLVTVAGPVTSFNGARSIDRDERRRPVGSPHGLRGRLQWGPVD